MRRPSAIPISAPLLAPDDAASAETSVAVSGRGSAGPGSGFGVDGIDGSVDSAAGSASAAGAAAEDSVTEPILLERPGVGGPAVPRLRTDAPEAPGGAGDVPFTARDLWQATRARRKALRSEIRRFTQRSRRRRIGWVIGVAVALLVVGGSVGAAYSPLFAVQTITVEGTTALKPADVQKALSGQVGRPLALVDSSAVKAALVTFPLIETYRLEAHPPHELVVRIVERTPVGVIQTGDGRFTVVDAAGVALSTTQDRPAGYAVIEVAEGTSSAAFTAVGTALRTLPAELRTQVDSAAASTPDDIVLQLAGGAKIVWGSADQSALKARSLQALMKVNPDASSYDVSSPGVGVLG